MAVTIRLARGGRKKVAFFSIVAADSRAARDGRFLEKLGTYNPQAEPKEFNIKADRIDYWLSQGAEVSETVANLLKQDKTVEKIAVGASGGDVSAIARLPERTRKPKAPKAAK